MKTAILAGGLGTRMQELTRLIPKPMVEIGSYPILWHIMKIYSHYGVNQFTVGLGYRGEVIKDFFTNYRQRIHSLRVDLGKGSVDVVTEGDESWVIDLVETGMNTQTGGRIARMREELGDAPFFLTYGDGVSDVDIPALLDFHRSHGKIGTVTAVRPPSKFGALDIGENGTVARFSEKPVSGDTWINGGFFVFEPEIFDYVSPDADCVFERGPLEALAADGQLAAFKHPGYWQCMDTARDVENVNEIWSRGQAPWKVWSGDDPKSAAKKIGSNK
jgi:glucose-1-phosphate cytidylyltransferase